MKFQQIRLLLLLLLFGKKIKNYSKATKVLQYYKILQVKNVFELTIDCLYVHHFCNIMQGLNVIHL
jgi:hypothetical protein